MCRRLMSNFWRPLYFTVKPAACRSSWSLRSSLACGCGASSRSGGPNRERSSDAWTNSIQSGPKVSIGCGARSLPLPQRKSFAAQYLSHPQQMRSGCAGRAGIRRIILPYALPLSLIDGAIFPWADACRIVRESTDWRGVNVTGGWKGCAVGPAQTR